MSTTALALLFASVTQTFNLPEGVMSAVCYVESSHRSQVIHKDDGHGNSVGLCQIKVETARLLGFTGNQTDLLNPYSNAYWAAKYLKKQLVRYDNDLGKALSAYNAGSHRVKNGKTRNQHYVDKVLKAMSNNL